ncbi:MAG: hypothetical protein QXQ41_00305 [Candidatus Bathyarchaeia archaeon]
MLSENKYGFLLILDEKWWSRLCGQKLSCTRIQAFVRRGLVGPVATNKLLFYVKHPVKQVMGVADFVERVAGDIKELWDRYGAETCLKNIDEYLAFLSGRKQATFIRFSNPRELKAPVPLEIAKRILGSPILPRGGKYINFEAVNQLTV